MSTHQIEFEPIGHIYKVNGLIQPSVTGILDGVGLIDSQWFTEQSRFRGTAVHALCELDNQDDLDESWIDEQENAKELRGYLEAHRKFKTETGFIPEASEERVFNGAYGYCGTLDERGKLGSGRPCLVDIKSGVVNRVTRYQLTGYAACLPNSFEWTRVALALRPNGNYTCSVYEIKDWRRDLGVWDSILQVYGLRKDLGMI